LKIWAHFRREAPETGLSAPIPPPPCRGLAVFPLQSLARLQTGAFFRKTGRYFSFDVKLLTC
jgi:hypothetical protein